MAVEKSDETRVYNNFSEGYLNAVKGNIQIWAKSRSVIQVVEVTTQIFAPYACQYISCQNSRITPELGVVLTVFILLLWQGLILTRLFV